MAKKGAPGAIFDQMQLDYDVAGTAAEDVMAVLTKAIDKAKASASNRREEVVTDGVTELNQAIDLVPDAIAKIAVARGSANTAAYDMPSVKAHKDEILAAIKQIKDWEKKLLNLDTAAKKQVEANFAAQDKMWESADAYKEAVGAMTKLLAEVMPLLGTMRPGVDSIYAQAAKAVETRYANGLALAQDDIDKTAIKRLEDAAAKLAALNKKAAELNQKVSQETRVEMMTQYGKARHQVEALDKEVQYLKERKSAIKAMKVTPIDIAKALKVLGLPASQKAALTKALSGDEARSTKALDEVGKQAKPAQTGKDMYAALRKAKVV